jgi:endonuclease III
MIPDKQQYAAEIGKKLYPEPVVELDYTTPFELMVASLLAAQNRDTNINKIPPNVHAHFVLRTLKRCLRHVADLICRLFRVDGLHNQPSVIKSKYQ